MLDNVEATGYDGLWDKNTEQVGMEKNGNNVSRFVAH